MAKGKGGVTAVVEALAAPVAQAQGLVLWDVRFEKEGPDRFLRVLADRADGEVMDTDACEKFSRALDPLLDEADPIPESYYLEVGSPGLGRRLTREEHFEAMAGREVTAHLYRPRNGQRDIEGILRGKTAEGVILTTAEEGDLTLEKDAVAYVKLNDDKDLF
ncbi:MAG: ribosome maturation factor RimP [Oscillospiraceae bacterium]|nr:ribosome maturation factor RimP [Oscillospiraceae bacterium]